MPVPPPPQNLESGPYPWFYPICFYQLPMTVIAVAIMCIVGNADVRVAAAAAACSAAAATTSLSLHGGSRHGDGGGGGGASGGSLRESASFLSPALRVSYVDDRFSSVAPGSSGLELGGGGGGGGGGGVAAALRPPGDLGPEPQGGIRESSRSIVSESNRV